MATFSTTTASSPLYWWDEGATDDYQIAFFSQAGARITTLAEAWAQSGIFLFLGAAQVELADAALSDRLMQFLRSPVHRHIRFLWIANPTEPVYRWRYQALKLTPKAATSPVIYRVTQLGLLTVRNYGLGIAGGVDCTLDAKNNCFVFTANAELHHGLNDAPGAGKGTPFFWATDYDAYRLRGVHQSGEQAIALPCTGPQAGCWQFDLTLRHPSGRSSAGEEAAAFEQLIHLNVALRLSFRYVDSPESDQPELNLSLLDTATDFMMSAHRYPLLMETAGNDQNGLKHYPKAADGTQDLTLYASVDPLQPLVRDRTEFSFVPRHGDLDPVLKAGLPSCYRTNLGYTLHLTPQPASSEVQAADLHSRLVFAERPTASESAVEPPLYLTPYGDFMLAAPHYDTAAVPPPSVTALPSSQPALALTDNFLCGLSGAEYFKLDGMKLSDQPRLKVQTDDSQTTERDIAIVTKINDQYQLRLVDSNGDVVLEQTPEQFALDDGLKAALDNAQDTSLQDAKNHAASILLAQYVNSLLARRYQPRHVLSFRDGEAAFLPAFKPKVSPSAPAATSLIDESVTLRTTTSWAYLRQVSPAVPEAQFKTLRAIEPYITYYAQPDLSLLYEASDLQDNNDDATDNLLRFLEVPVTPVPHDSPDSTFPLLPYGGVEGDLRSYRQLEQQFVNPQRRSRIHQISAPLYSRLEGLPSIPEIQALEIGDHTAPLIFEPSNTDKVGVTPQGLLATYSQDFANLQFLMLARVQTDDTSNPSRDFGFGGNQPLPKHTPLREAFQSNQLFLVISNPTQNLLPFFNATLGRQDFTKIIIQDWLFDLDPSVWKEDTILIFKFFDRPLSNLIEDTSIWSFKDDFNGADSSDDSEMPNAQQVSKNLVDYFQQVREKASENAPKKDQESYEHLARILDLDDWSGILALNVKVPPSELPDALIALAAGIDEEQFFAQYVMIEATPILPNAGKLNPQPSSLFGLIDYKDNSIPKVGEAGYAFKVAMLRVRFHNSQVVDFASDVNLTIDQLFDEGTQLLNSRTGRNVLIFKGSAETHNGKTKYAFTFSGESYFVLPDSQVLDNINIVKANFTTDPLPDEASNDATITGRFTFWGEISFRYLQDFDALSFGPYQAVDRSILQKDLAGNTPNNLAIYPRARSLVEDEDDSDDGNTENDRRTASEKRATELQRLEENKQVLLFSNLLITMTFPRGAPDTEPTFVFDAGQLAFDLKRSQVRPSSLYARFPIKLVDLIQISNAAQLSSYLPVASPLGSGSSPAAEGYGLVFNLNLGGLGSLAGAAKLVAKLVVAWTPNTDASQSKPQVFVGLQMPGVGGDVLGFPLQNVLKLSFKKVEFVAVNKSTDEDNPNFEYLLKIKNVALKMLTLSFPPNGQTEIIIFGNSDPKNKDAVGWYAAYAKEPQPLPEGQPNGRASPQRTRQKK